MSYLAEDRSVCYTVLYKLSLYLIDLIIPAMIHLLPLCLYLLHLTKLYGICLSFGLT